MEQAPALKLKSVIGFQGSTANGLVLHPDGETLLYPLGSTVVIRRMGDVATKGFLRGHTDKISCIALSKSGRFLATGQVAYMGFPADIIVWDLEAETVEEMLVHRLTLHRVQVQSLAFSHDEKYLASIGGQDDQNLVVWDIEIGKAVCGSPASNDHVLSVAWYNTTSAKLVTSGNYHLRIWDFDKVARKVRPTNVLLGKAKRVVTTVFVDDEDRNIYAGTSTGDVVAVGAQTGLFMFMSKQRVGKGILCSRPAPNGDIIVGGGDGSVSIFTVAGEGFKMVSSIAVGGPVTSIVLTGEETETTFGFMVGTKLCNMYHGMFDAVSRKFSVELRQSCHFDKINDAVFPSGLSDVFATCAFQDIRVWHKASCRELLRISLPNLECQCMAFLNNGSAIISGWSDGRIRAFGPQSGKLLFTINDAHLQGVTAIASSTDSQRIVSGGKMGEVRVWRLGAESQIMIASMKEHKGQVNAVMVRSNDLECVSASSDGSCTIWDLERFTRSNSVFASTFFKAILYHPDENQLLTTGTDRKITFWDAFDGNAIRIIDGSMDNEVNSLAISADGDNFVSGGGDKVVKLWGYDSGEVAAVGMGHSGVITKVIISPDQSSIVSVGSEGAIYIWDYAF